MAFLGLDDGLQSRSPLVNGTIDQSLTQFSPASPDLLFQVVEDGDAVPVNHLLQYTPHGIVQRVGFKSGLFAGHKAGSMKSGTFRAAEIRSAFTACAFYA